MVAVCGGTAGGREPSWHSTRCWIQVAPPEVVECGYVEVPERRDRDTRPIHLAVTILRSPSQSPKADPILYLNGGPGFPAYASWHELDWWIFQTRAFRQDRDVVIIDQRGLRRSFPALICPELIDLRGDVVDWPDGLKHSKKSAVKALLGCRERYLDQGIDLAAYTTQESAPDVDAVATALGVEQYNLIGASYGTRLALEVMRRFPERVRSVVLDGVYPPHIRSDIDDLPATKRIFLKLLDDCENDKECAAAHPDFKNRVLDWVDGLSLSPRRYGPISWSHSRVMDAEGLMAMLLIAFRDVEEVAFAPDILAHAINGNYKPFSEYFSGISYANAVEASGQHFSVQCADNWFPDISETFEAAAREYYPYGGTARTYLYSAVCHNWFPEGPPPVDLSPVSSDIPTLILNGGYDIVTPMEWGVDTARRLPRSQTITIDAGGHIQLFDVSCVIKAAVTFLNDPSADMGAFCPDRDDGMRFRIRAKSSAETAD
ncbi:MAG: alpha/beta hydrolase [Inquilinaceae bacterium]